MLAQAVELDPEYAAAHAWWACWHFFQVGQGWAKDPAAAMERAGELATRATRLDPADARGLTIAGHVRAYLHHRVEEALDLHERALRLNPNLPIAWALSGIAHTYVGLHEEAIRRIHRARELSPHDPHGFFFDMALMMPHLLRGDFETVVHLGRRALALNSGLTSTYKGMLSALGHLGRSDESAPLRAQLLALDPEFQIRRTVERTPLARAEDRTLYAEGLRRAGLPG
jgi:tetratricopeptide (TPR) repeat protein